METLSRLMRLLQQGEGPRPAKCRRPPQLQLQILADLNHGRSVLCLGKGHRMAPSQGPLTSGAGAVGVHFEPSTGEAS